MRKLWTGISALVLFGIGAAHAATPSDAEIRQQMIQDSIASYPDNCPCPYNVARNGSSCGRRSAYSRPGGHVTLCYPSDIPKSMVDYYRRMHGL